MKLKSRVAASVMVLLMVVSFSTEKNLVPDESVNLQDAEKQKSVKSKVVSNGNYTGDCIDLTLSNQKSAAVKIKVPAGTVFTADDSGEQNILVTNDIFCFLKPGESKSFDISGYCCEKNDSAPDDGSTFKTGLHNDEKVKKLVEFMKDKNYSDGVKQEAIWTVANGSPVTNVSLENEKQHKELRKFLCDLTGQKETWYSTPQNYTMNERREISSVTTEVKGNIGCDVDKPTEVTNEIYDSNNELQFSMGPMLFPRKGHYNYEFKVKVRGWDKGKYYVIIKGGEKQLLKQEFEL